MNKNIKICTIGGGTGMPIVNSALANAGFENIKSIVTTFDSGGDTGRIRTDERGNVLAFSDFWRSLVSLWMDGEQKWAWEEMLRYRDGRGRNFGNIFFQFLSEREGGLSEVDDLFCKLTGAKLAGEVIPVALNPAELCFRTISGKEYVGENFVDELRMSSDRIDDIWLSPKVRINEEAAKAVEKADLIIVGPGTTYGSVLPNFLPEGMVKAYNRSRAKKIFLVNIFSAANEIVDPTQVGYMEIFKKYLKTKTPFDLMVMADVSEFDKKQMERILYLYNLEHAALVKLEDNKQIKTLVADVLKIEEKNMRLRHSEEKLAKLFKTLEW